MRPSSLRLFLLALAAVAPALTACWVEPDPTPAVQNVAEPSPPVEAPAVSPTRVAIATGETMTSDPGNGAGVFVEYHGDGEWKIWTTCDSLRTGTTCRYRLDLDAEAGASIQQVRVDGSGTDSVVLMNSKQSAITSLSTGDEIDAIQFRMDPPGASLQLEAQLDGQADGRLIFWVGPDVLHTGAPTNPVIFDPIRPLAPPALAHLAPLHASGRGFLPEVLPSPGVGRGGEAL